jgi:GT2 family glycosyltransferase/glycosyltransferase involved in cell wall biosynthesis
VRKEFRSIERLRKLTELLSAQYRADRSDLQAQVAYEHKRYERAESRLSEVLDSRSWRITESLRRLVAWMRQDGVGGPDPLDQKHAIDESVLRPPPDVVQAEQVIYQSLEQVPKDLLTDIAQVQLDVFLSSGASISFAEPDHPQISVLLILFNRAELTLSCLRSLFAEKDTCYEVVIVDNASTDSTSRLLSRIHGVTILHNKENNHFLRGVNQAAEAARGKHLLILNNDTELLPGSLVAALTTLESKHDIGAVGAKLILPDGRLQEAGSIVWEDGSCLGYARGLDPIDPVAMFRRDVDYCSAAFLLTPKDIFDRLGGFDTRYEPAYYEETDYCMRLWQAGLRVVYEPAAVILHHEFASSKLMSDATALHGPHQEIFVRTHQESLKKHHAYDIDAILNARFASQNKRRKMLFIDDQIPSRAAGSGFPRSHRILTGVVERGHAVTFFPTDSQQVWEEIYRHIPKDVEVMPGRTPGQLETFLEERHKYFDTILVSRPHNMEYLGAIVRNHPDWFEDIPIVYDAEALFSLRELGSREISGEVISEEERERIIQEEVSLAVPADIVTTASELEGKIFTGHGIRRVEALGHSLHPTPTARPFEERNGFLFVGPVYEETSPNGDSVLWFLDKVLPLVREALGSDIRFTIAGVTKSARIHARAFEGVRITGVVDDLTPMYANHRVFVAPTRFGAGIPHKVHEAAAHGLPVMATGLLAAQLRWEDRVHLSVADGAEEFAGRLIELYTDPIFWESIRVTALERVEVDCSPERFDEQLDSIFANPVIKNGIEKRAQALAVGQPGENG